MTDNNQLIEDFAKIGQAHVLCIGDIALDRFIYGAVHRMSREAPIPVLVTDREKNMPGAVGNAAVNLSTIGARATVITLTGQDREAEELQALLEDLPNVTAQLVPSPRRETTIKTRYVCGGKQMFRADRERNQAPSTEEENDIISRAAALMPDVHAVILSDYDGGLLTDRLLREIITLARQHDTPVVIDPRGHDFSRYKGATLITPNRKELETATRHATQTEDDIRAACMQVIADSGIPAVLATRDKDGMALITEKQEPVFIPAHVREVYDVSGAGDTVITMLAACIGAGVTLENAARLANIAAGIAVGKAGTASVRPEEVHTALHTDTLKHKTKIVSMAAAAEQAERWRAKGLTVGFTNGAFDLLHLGHLSSIRQTKEHCDRLVVAVNSDASVKRAKGDDRPIQDQTTRATVLAALEMIDMVFIFEEDTVDNSLKAIKPDIMVKGAQYGTPEQVPEYPTISSFGGKIILAKMEEGFSTSTTVTKIAGVSGKKAGVV